MIDYELVTKYLIEYYEKFEKKEYTHIWLDFASFPGRISVRTIKYGENGKMTQDIPVVYDYEYFEDITRRLKSGEMPWWKQPYWKQKENKK